MRTLQILATAVALASSGCRLGRFDTDAVAPGDYGPTQSGSGGAHSATPPPTAGTPLGQIGNAATGGPAATSGRSAPGAAAEASGTFAMSGAAGVSATAGASGAASTVAPMAGSSGEPAAIADAGAPATANPCDLSGRWLSTVHTVTDALGQQQIAHSFVYYEIKQQGDAFMVAKGIDCGDSAEGAGSFAATVDFRPTWPAVISRAGLTGRTGTSSAAASGGCQIDLAKWYTVRGATVPYYNDPSKPMPSAEQKATGDQPGWEDWDADGNPGITGMVSGAVTGKIFTAPRVWTHVSGTVTDITATFKLSVQWDQEPNVMAVDGSPLLQSDAARAADAALHFAEFARLAPDQAVGDDLATCTSLVTLAPMLTPAAAGM